MLQTEVAGVLDEHDGWDWVLEGVGPWIDWDAGIKCSCGARIPPKDEGSTEDWHRAHVSEVIAGCVLGAQSVYEALAECAELDAKYIEFFRHYDSSEAHTAARWLRGMARLVEEGGIPSRRWDPFRKEEKA